MRPATIDATRLRYDVARARRAAAILSDLLARLARAHPCDVVSPPEDPRAEVARALREADVLAARLHRLDLVLRPVESPHAP